MRAVQEGLGAIWRINITSDECSSLWFQSMRGLCREEDYEFLGNSEKTQKRAEGAGVPEDDWGDKKEERVRKEEPAFFFFFS